MYTPSPPPPHTRQGADGGGRERERERASRRRLREIKGIPYERHAIPISARSATSFLAGTHPETREPSCVLEVRWRPTTCSPKKSITGAPLEPVVLTVPRITQRSASLAITTPGETTASWGGFGESHTVATCDDTDGRYPRKAVYVGTGLLNHSTRRSQELFFEAYVTDTHCEGRTSTLKSPTSSFTAL